MGKYTWSEWNKFPDPNKKEFLIAPIGSGVYQLGLLKNEHSNEIKEYVLYGYGKNVASRMCSLLPIENGGAGGRKNNNKKKFVIDNIRLIVYRTIACDTEEEAKNLEENLGKGYKHRFNS